MNRKQRRIAQAQGNIQDVVRIQGTPRTLNDANALAMKEYGLGHFEAAADIYRLILTQVPGNADAHNNLGVVLQVLKRFEEALASHDKAIALKADWAPFHYNRGNSLRSLQRPGDALASYNQAIALDPRHAEACSNKSAVLQEMKRYEEALASSDKAVAIKPGYAEGHNNRGGALHAMRRYDEALASYDKAIALKPDFANAHNNRGNVLRELGRYEEALASNHKALAIKPGHAEIYNNQSLILQEMNRHGEALASGDKAVALKPDYAEAYNNRGLTLHKMKRYEDALANYDKAIALKRDYVDAYSNMGTTLQEMKRYGEALANYDKAIALKSDFAEAYQNRGVILMNKGDMKEAEKMFRKALALRPDFPNPYFSLTSIGQCHDADIKTIRALLDKPGASLRGRDYLYFALGKIYDDGGRYDEAFECYRQANQILNREVSYSPGGIARLTDSIIDVFSKEFLAQPFPFASDSRSPLFIVGMPRSGTTLMASILSNHPGIDTAGELPTMTELTLRLPGYPRDAKHLTPAIASRMINDYEQSLRRDVGADAPCVIDKHPLNFRHLGFIAMLFPKARVIHCTRHALDTGLSNYFQRFALDYGYSFDLANIGHFYGEYARTMAHWRNALPTQMIDVSYEDMISNTELTARKTLDFLGLEWDERCLAPHTNPSPVETASSWQVRQPIYTQAIGRWRHYEKHLAPLKDALQRAGQLPD